MSLWKGRIEIKGISNTFDIGYHLLTVSLCFDIFKGSSKVLLEYLKVLLRFSWSIFFFSGFRCTPTHGYFGKFTVSRELKFLKTGYLLLLRKTC